MFLKYQRTLKLSETRPIVNLSELYKSRITCTVLNIKYIWIYKCNSQPCVCPWQMGKWAMPEEVSKDWTIIQVDYVLNWKPQEWIGWPLVDKRWCWKVLPWLPWIPEGQPTDMAYEKDCAIQTKNNGRYLTIMVIV